MFKFYKHRLYKKYQDELWGHIISKKQFSYNKRSILLNYRDVILRNRLRIKTKFKYFRRGFLKNLNYTLLLFKFFRKSIRVLSFKRRESLSAPLSLGSISFRHKRRVFFRSSKILGLLKINILCTNFSSLSRICTNVYRIRPYLNIYKQSKLFQLPTIAINKRSAFYNSRIFLRTNNLQFVIKKKLIYQFFFIRFWKKSITQAELVYMTCPVGYIHSFSLGIRIWSQNRPIP